MKEYTCKGCQEIYKVRLPLIPGGMIERGFCSPGCEFIYRRDRLNEKGAKIIRSMARRLKQCGTKAEGK